MVTGLAINALGANTNSRPNLLMMIADDLCWRDLGYQGHPNVKTPNLDRLPRRECDLNACSIPPRLARRLAMLFTAACIAFGAVLFLIILGCTMARRVSSLT